MVPGVPERAAAGNNVIDVTTTDDELIVDGDCSLREAVVAANTNVALLTVAFGISASARSRRSMPQARLSGRAARRVG
jgi:CSLREA domain-containing protein